MKNIYVHKDPNYQIPDYYEKNINLQPEEFNQLSNDIKLYYQSNKNKIVEASCNDEQKDYLRCKSKVTFLSEFFCTWENNSYRDCLRVNKEKFDKYLKYYIYTNKESYISYWEDQYNKYEKEQYELYLKQQQNKTNK